MLRPLRKKRRKGDQWRERGSVYRKKDTDRKGASEREGERERRTEQERETRTDRDLVRRSRRVSFCWTRIMSPFLQRDVSFFTSLEY